MGWYLRVLFSPGLYEGRCIGVYTVRNTFLLFRPIYFMSDSTGCDCVSFDDVECSWVHLYSPERCRPTWTLYCCVRSFVYSIGLFSGTVQNVWKHRKSTPNFSSIVNRAWWLVVIKAWFGTVSIWQLIDIVPLNSPMSLYLNMFILCLWASHPPW